MQYLLDLDNIIKDKYVRIISFAYLKFASNIYSKELKNGQANSTLDEISFMEKTIKENQEKKIKQLYHLMILN